MKNYIGLFIILIIFYTSCSEFIEVSLQEETVQLIAPGNKSTQTSYTQTFWWEKVNGATRYRIQIVRPGFDSILNLVCDSLVGSNKITFSLSPGDYEWRVRAENNTSESRYSTWSLSIDTVSIANEKVLLVGPQNNFFTNATSTTLSWSELFGADSYTIQIDTLSFSNDSNILVNTNVSSTNFLFNFPKEKTFLWRVRANNTSQTSRWSDVYSITSDRTAPETANLLSPANNQTTSLPVVLNWSTIADANQYKIYLYKQDSTSLYNASFPLLTGATSYTFTSGTLGEKIVWRVKTIDKAGNESSFSAFRSFIVN